MVFRNPMRIWYHLFTCIPNLPSYTPTTMVRKRPQANVFSTLEMVFRNSRFEHVFEILFDKGGFNMFHWVFGKYVCYEFANLFPLEEELDWVCAICACHFMKLLPHPAYAVLLFRDQNSRSKVKESVIAWDLAKQCGLHICFRPRILVGAMRIFCPTGGKFRDAIQMELFHKKRSPEEWKSFAEQLFHVCFWWNQPEAPFLESLDMKDAISILAKNEGNYDLRNRNSVDYSHVLTTVRGFFERKNVTTENFETIIANFVLVVEACPNLKWRLSNVLHVAASRAGIESGDVEMERFKYGRKQFSQTYNFPGRKRKNADTPSLRYFRS